MKSFDILIVGVGGQGTLLASKLLGKLYLKKGCDIKVSEVHGMSQRGGSVVTYVRAGDRVFSPMIDLGEADMIISFETLESARWLPYLKTGGVVISNTREINPMPVISGACEYPEDVLEKIQKLGIKVIKTDAAALADAAGSIKAVNIALLGVAAKELDFSVEEWQEAIKETVPAKTVEINEKAFMLGYESQN